MDLHHLHQKLLEMVRSEPADETVPAGFERRVMTRLAGLKALDPWAWWGAIFWRVSVPCLGITAAALIWTLGFSPPVGSEMPLSTQLENVVLGSLLNFQEAW